MGSRVAIFALGDVAAVAIFVALTRMNVMVGVTVWPRPGPAHRGGLTEPVTGSAHGSGFDRFTPVSARV
jgi:hypothetical protein